MAVHAIRKLCPGHATKNVLVGLSAEPVRAHWDRNIVNEWNIRNETRADIKTQTCANWQERDSL